MSARNIDLTKMKPAPGTIRAISAEGGLRAACGARAAGDQRLPGEPA